MRRMIVTSLALLAFSCSLAGFAQAQSAPSTKSTPAPSKMEAAKSDPGTMAKQPRHTLMARERVHLSKDEVTSLQNALATAGFYKGKVDGLFGRQTRMALRAYQKQQGLAVNGRPDAETVAKLGITVAPEHVSPATMSSHKASHAAAKKP